MDKKENEGPEVIQGLTPADRKAIEDFKREMNEKVIPEILEAVEERCILAAESRQWHLKS
jgi:hypothetical protein